MRLLRANLVVRDVVFERNRDRCGDDDPGRRERSEHEENGREEDGVGWDVER